MSETLEIINPLDYPDWDKVILTNKDYSFFHSSSWARVLHESYGYKPLYFTTIRDNRLVTLIPFMEVKSMLTGKRGVCLPFSDYCAPIISEKNDSLGIFHYLIRYGKEAGWKTIEIRDGNIFPNDLPPTSRYYYTHTLDLTEKDEQIFSNFRESTKRNIKKALLEDIKVNILYSLESINKFYRLNCITRKKHGIPPQPYSFFRKIYEHILTKNSGFVVIASYRSTPIAGAIYFRYGDKAIYKYGASDTSLQHLRANNLIMWEAIKWCVQNGYKSLCFGRTEPENNGLRQFKAGWGTTENTIRYIRYDIVRKKFVANDTHVKGFHSKIFRRMPIPLSKLIGRVLYVHMG